MVFCAERFQFPSVVAGRMGNPRPLELHGQRNSGYHEDVLVVFLLRVGKDYVHSFSSHCSCARVPHFASLSHHIERTAGNV